MKVRDLLKMEIDIDVYDNVCEALGIAFCGAMELTKEGEERFKEVLDYDVEIKKGYVFDAAIVDIDFPDWEERLYKAKDLFYSLAGYCAADDYDRWFKEV